MRMLKIKGFSLVELMIVVAIIGLVLFVVMSIFQRTNKSFYQGQLKFIADSEAQLLIEYIKRDLSMACKLENSSSHLKDSVVKWDEAKKEWEFYKFDQYIDGKPETNKIKYKYDVDAHTVTRFYDGNPMRVWQGVTYFFIHYYGLLPQHRFFYNINLEITVGEENPTAKSESLFIVTSVESKYENTLVNFPGWLKNTSSVIEK